MLVVGCSHFRGQSNAAHTAQQSPYTLTSDVQYFPPGEKFKLLKQVQALEEYKREQERLRSGVKDEAN